MAFARHGCQDDVARLVALGADSRRVDARGRDAAMHAHARGHAAVRDRLLAATPPNPPKRVASEVHPKRSFLDGVSAYYEDDQDVSHGDDAEMVGLPLDDFVYDVYAYDATADVEPRRVSTSRDHDGAQSLPDDLSRTVDCESLASRAMTPGGDTLSSSGESEDDDGLSTRCVVSPRRRSRAAPLVVGICVEINQCVGSTRKFFTKSFLGDDVAALVPSSGEEPTPPYHRAGVASMAWKSTRRFRTNAP